MVLFNNDTVTMFNRHFDSITEDETWLPTVLTNCNLVVSQGANIERTGIKDADSAKLFIDDNCTDKPFVKAKTWKALTLAEKADVYTATSDENHPDFYVKGDLSDISLVSIDNVYEYMLKRYDDVYRVTTVDVYEDVMPHTEIGGR